MKWLQICPVTHSLLRLEDHHPFLVKQQQRQLVSNNTFDTQQQLHLGQACSLSPWQASQPLFIQSWFMTPTPLLLKTSPCWSPCPSVAVTWKTKPWAKPTRYLLGPLPKVSKHECRKSIQLHGLQPRLTLSCSLALSPLFQGTLFKKVICLLLCISSLLPHSSIHCTWLPPRPLQLSTKFLTTCILCNPKDTSPFLFSFRFLLRNP